MDGTYLERLNLDRVHTPCFVVDENLLKRNLSVLDDVQRRTGAKILLALKCFSMFSVFPILNKALHGVCASSPHEARLGREEFGREVHTFAAAYSEEDVKELITLSDHIIFNSFGQWERFRPIVKNSGRDIECGIRVNPEHSEGSVPIYDPCSPGSRLGVRRRNFDLSLLEGIDGLHFHTLCEHNADALERTLTAFEEKFGEFIPRMKWINFGGGHHITRDDYDVDLLCDLINSFRERYSGIDVYLEPGEAVALNAGILVASVLDVIDSDMPSAILDASAAAHMPDVLEMPYRPNIIGSGMAGEKKYSYRLGGHTCLAGDVIGEYSFDQPLKVGDKLAFTDMAIYSMVKTNTFNGVKLPSIAVYRPDQNDLIVVREFDYNDFKSRLS